MADYTYITTHQGEEIFLKTCADRLSIPDSGLDSWTLTTGIGELATIPISDLNNCITIGTANLYEPRPRRLKCEYCGCISSKEFGTCEHCGAPLTIEIV